MAWIRCRPGGDRFHLNTKQKNAIPSRYGVFFIRPAAKRGPTAGRGVFGGSSPPNPRSRGRLPLHPHSAIMVGRLSEIFPRETWGYAGLRPCSPRQEAVFGMNRIRESKLSRCRSSETPGQQVDRGLSIRSGAAAGCCNTSVSIASHRNPPIFQVQVPL